MDSPSPLISVIVPVYRTEAFLDATIKSVLKQTYSNYEIIIVFDGPSDYRLHFEERYSEDRRIRIFQLPENAGAGAARRFGITCANGTYIAFLDSDDQWLPDKLNYQIGFMIATKALATCTAYNVVESGELQRSITPRQDIGFEQIVRYCDIGNSTVVLAQDICRQVLYETGSKEDFRTWLKICRRGYRFVGLPQVASIYILRKDSSSGQKILEAAKQFRALRECGGLSFLTAFRMLIVYAARAIYVRT